MIATLLLSSMIVRPRLDAWDLKPAWEAGKKIVYSVSAVATGNGREANASFGHSFTPAAPDANGDRKAKVEWTEIKVEDNDQETPDPFEVVVGADGTIKEATLPKDDLYRRFLSVFTFSYPGKPVEVGDKWTTEQKPTGAGKMTFAFEAKEVTKLNDVEVLHVVGKQTEDGSEAITNNSDWWLGRDGKIVRFKLDIKNWIVPIAGPEAMNVELTANLKDK